MLQRIITYADFKSARIWSALNMAGAQVIYNSSNNNNTNDRRGWGPVAGSRNIISSYAWCRNNSCERPIRLSWLRSVSGHEAEFEIEHVGFKSSVSSGRARIIYTDYRSALVYQCFQLLSDGACVPSHVSVEVWSRRPTMPETRYSPTLPHICNKR